MANAPHFNVDLKKFYNDPYPTFEKMRNSSPISYVPEFDSILITKREDIYKNEKLIDVFSSVQPNGLMVKLMGQNMMRKDGEQHTSERRGIFQTISPKTVQKIWKREFEKYADYIIEQLKVKKGGNLFRDYGINLSAKALILVTGLKNMSIREMDSVSQGMIDGIANYNNDRKVEENCNKCTSLIDCCVDEMIPRLSEEDFPSLLKVQVNAGFSNDQIKANIKLAISGGQNEPRDAISGSIWALLSNPKQISILKSNKANMIDVFEEYCRWISPVGMSPRRIAKKYIYKGINFSPNEKIFLMFGSANRDEDYFEKSDEFILERDRSASIPFGAGPHFCAGAWISKCLVGEVALPKLFKNFPNIRLDPEQRVNFFGWAFRGPDAVICNW